MLITFIRTYLCKFFRCLPKLQSFQNKPFALKPWDDLTNLPRRELVSFLSTKQGMANMDLYPQPGLLWSQFAALTRPRWTPSGFTITYVLSEPPCIQCHLSKQAFAHRKISLWRWPIQCSWNQNCHWWWIWMPREGCMSLHILKPLLFSYRWTEFLSSQLWAMWSRQLSQKDIQNPFRVLYFRTLRP
jgi:hypothetical protein